MGSFTAPSQSVPASLGSCSLCALLEGWKIRSLLKREVPSKDTLVCSTTLIIYKQLEDNKEMNRPQNPSLGFCELLVSRVPFLQAISGHLAAVRLRWKGKTGLRGVLGERNSPKKYTDTG